METNILTTARDVERTLSNFEFAATLRQLADSIEQRTPFEIEVDGELVRAPLEVELSIEHERSDDEEELEFQLKWTRPARPEDLDTPETEEAVDALS